MLELILSCLVLGFVQEEARLPIPDAAAQKKAEALIRDVFKADFAKARDSASRTSLAEKLLNDGRSTSDDPVGRYTLFRLARDLAAEAGSLDVAMDSIDTIASFHDADAFDMKAELLERLSKTPQTPAQQKVISEKALTLVDEAFAVDKHLGASRLTTLAVSSAAKANSPEQLRIAKERQSEVAELAKLHQVAQKALVSLKENPADQASSLIAGRFLCFIKNEWSRGLPMLVVGGDASLKTVATQDLAAPSEQQALLELGDAWWLVGSKESGLAKSNIQERAGIWYRKAVPSLTGLTKARVEGRLKELEQFGIIHRLSGHTAGVQALAISKDGRLAATGGLDKIIIVWDMTTGKKRQQLVGHTGNIQWVDFHPNGTHVLSGSLDGTIRIWNIASGKDERKLAAHAEPGVFYTKRLLAQGKHLLSHGYDKSVRLWDLQTAKPLKEFRIAQKPAANTWVVDFSVDGKYALVGGPEGGVRLWSVASGSETKRFEGAVAHGGRFSHDGKLIALDGPKSPLQVWNVESGTMVHKATSSGAYAFLNKRPVLAIVRPDGIDFADARNGKVIRTLDGDGGGIITISSDDQWALTVANDNVVRVWRLAKNWD